MLNKSLAKYRQNGRKKMQLRQNVSFSHPPDINHGYLQNNSLIMT